MKKITTIFFIFLSIAAYAGDFERDTVFVCNGKTEGVLYGYAKGWIAETFTPTIYSNIITEDRENGSITCTSSFYYAYKGVHYGLKQTGNYTGKITYTLKIQVKDSKIRFHAYDFFHFGNFYPKWSLNAITNESPDPEWPKSKINVWDDAKQRSSIEMEVLEYSLCTYIKKQKDEW